MRTRRGLVAAPIALLCGLAVSACSFDSADEVQLISGVCGDGVVDATEECDDGNEVTETCDWGEGDCTVCNASCEEAVGVRAFCGDGVLNGPEECDEGIDNSDSVPNRCRTDCSQPVCGDGVVDAGEACDDGAENSDSLPGACRTDCTPANCGDGILDLGEECDDGPFNSNSEPDACRRTCRLAGCGDAVLDHGETCDNGEHNSDTAPDACRTTCVPATCGDDVVDTGEECDTGDSRSDTTPDACRLDCSDPGCGDLVIDSGEQCDNGGANSDTTPDACRTSCQNASCGDDVIDTGETCDDGGDNSNTNPDACRLNCEPAGCADNVIDTGEECDDGNEDDGDGCEGDCTFICADDAGADRTFLRGTTCYLAFDSPTTWPDAQSVCGVVADHLVDIEDAAENAFVDTFVNTSTWIGYNDLDTEGAFEWDGGEPYTYTNWNGGEPNNSGNEDCTEMRADGRWNDHRCTGVTRPFVCKQDECGNGNIDPGETCDDGNSRTEDCPYGGGPCIVCDNTCNNGPGNLNDCNDGNIDAGEGEECDDGRNDDNDGCDASCLIEEGYFCEGEPSDCFVGGTAAPEVDTIDDAYDGTLASMVCGDIAITKPGSQVGDIEVEVSMSHTWVGDLTMKLESPDGTVVTLMSRPGDDEPADDGSECCGDSSDLLGSNPIIFADGEPVSAEDMGQAEGSGAVCTGANAVCEYDPDPDSAGGPGLAGFNGENIDGTWRFCVGDGAGGDNGTLHYVNLRISEL